MRKMQIPIQFREHVKYLYAIGFLAVLIGASSLVSMATAQVEASQLRTEQRVAPYVSGQYIVSLKKNINAAAEANMATAQGGKVLRIYKAALNGFAAQLSDEAVKALKNNPNVLAIEQDAIVDAATTEANATWGLDRIDQTVLPLSTTYTYEQIGAGVTVYIIDTGIRATHQEFGGRVQGGVSFINDTNGTNDCNGHGTHVAGTVGGSTYGVAKGVTISPVRVLGCDGTGLLSDIIAGIDWVTANHQSPAVANMSIQGPKSDLENQAIENSINAGIVYVVAAGNFVDDACLHSPSSAQDALTIGATKDTDTMSGFSNWGTCLDLLAPGEGVTSAGFTSDIAIAVMNGTSMASPHVAGAAALYIEQNPTATPAQVALAIKSETTNNVLWIFGAGTPNKLLYSLNSGLLRDPSADNEAPTVPTNVVATVSSSAAALSWTSSSDNIGVTGYSILRDSVILATSSSPAYTDYAVSIGTTYAYTIRAFDAAGNISAASVAKSVTIPAPAPFAILNSSVSNVTKNSAIINWSTNYDSTARVTITKKRGDSVVFTDTLSQTSHSLSAAGLTSGTSYTYTISATRSDGTTGTASVSGSFKTLR